MALDHSIVSGEFRMVWKFTIGPNPAPPREARFTMIGEQGPALFVIGRSPRRAARLAAWLQDRAARCRSLAQGLTNWSESAGKIAAACRRAIVRTEQGQRHD